MKCLATASPGAAGCSTAWSRVLTVSLFMLSSLSCALAKGLSCLVILPNTTVDAFRNDAAKMYGARLDLESGPVVFMDAIDGSGSRRPPVPKRIWNTNGRPVS